MGDRNHGLDPTSSYILTVNSICVSTLGVIKKITSTAAARFIVQKTEARIVLSSDWRKQDVLVEGIGSAFEEHGIPMLYSSTPDLDQATPGVIKALHSSFREKRCKEIRKWLKQNPKITHFCAIDDVDLSMPDKAALKSGLRDTDIFLDPDKEFVKTSPTTKWLVICCHMLSYLPFLNIFKTISFLSIYMA